MPFSPTPLRRALATGSVVACLALGLPGSGALPAAAAPEPTSLPAGPSGLDASGRKLPATYYPVPTGAVYVSPSGDDADTGGRVRPVRTLNRAVSLAREGGTIVFRGGEYRDWYTQRGSYGIVAKSLTFQAYPGERPWLNGSDVVPASRWQPTADGKEWTLPWSTPELCDDDYYTRPPTASRDNPCAHTDMVSDPRYPVAGDPQMVFVDGRQLRQVPLGTRLDSGTFAYDWERRRMAIGLDPAGRIVEVARRPLALVLGGRRDYTVRGIGFRRFASNQFHNMTSAALYVGGARFTVENTVFAENAGAGVSISGSKPGSVVRRSVFAANGYMGLGANGGSQKGTRNDLVVDSNVFSRNNGELFGGQCTVSCGQAAAKFAHMVGLTLSRNHVADTRGKSAGFWCDLDCSDTRYIYNVIENHGGGAIFHEVSDTGIIAANLLRNNTYGVIVASANTKVYNNTLVDNVQGINVYDDNRTRGEGGWGDVGPDTRNVAVVNNVVSGRNYSLMGAGAKKGSKAPNTDVGEVFSRIDSNAYHQSNGTRPIFVYWRDLSGQEKHYRDKSAFVAEHRQSSRSAWLTGRSDPLFVDKGRGDYRIRASSPVSGLAEDLPADVARALGVPTREADRPVGAFRAP